MVKLNVILSNGEVPQFMRILRDHQEDIRQGIFRSTQNCEREWERHYLLTVVIDTLQEQIDNGVLEQV